MSIVTVSEIRFFSSRPVVRLKAQLVDQLRLGMQPQQLAMALALGATIGLLPTIWGTSLICLLVAFGCRLNQLLVQLANYLVYPLQILLFVPYFKLGERLFLSDNLSTDIAVVLERLQAAPLAVLEQYWQANLQAVFAWLLTSPLLLVACLFSARLLIDLLHLAETDV